MTGLSTPVISVVTKAIRTLKVMTTKLSQSIISRAHLPFISRSLRHQDDQIAIKITISLFFTLINWKNKLKTPSFKDRGHLMLTAPKTHSKIIGHNFLIREDPKTPSICLKKWKENSWEEVV